MFTCHYQDYSGPARRQDQVATLVSDVEMTIDGRNLHYNRDGSLRDGCKQHKGSKTAPPYRCRLTHLIVTLPPGHHTIGAILYLGGGIKISGPNCYPYLCLLSKDIDVDAGRTYSVDVIGPSGFVFSTPTPISPPEILVKPIG